MTPTTVRVCQTASWDPCSGRTAPSHARGPIGRSDRRTPRWSRRRSDQAWTTPRSPVSLRSSVANGRPAPARSRPASRRRRGARTHPAGRLRPREGVRDAQAVAVQPLELVSIDHVLPGARREEQSCVDVAARCRAEADHRHQRDDPRPATNEQQWAALGGLPDEVAANWPPKLDLIAGPELVHQVGRDLAVVEALDRELDASSVRRRRDRVAPLCLIAVRSGQADVDVLSGSMPCPGRNVERDRLDPRRLPRDLDDLRDLPAQSPQYRCSRHGSP
jgi:hypothetical protein